MCHERSDSAKTNSAWWFFLSAGHEATLWAGRVPEEALRRLPGRRLQQQRGWMGVCARANIPLISANLASLVRTACLGVTSRSRRVCLLQHVKRSSCAATRRRRRLKLNIRRVDERDSCRWHHRRGLLSVFQRVRGPWVASMPLSRTLSVLSLWRRGSFFPGLCSSLRCPLSFLPPPSPLPPSSPSASRLNNTLLP